MDSIVNSVIPLFSVVFVGYLAGKGGIIDQLTVKTLVTFVFNIAMPALLFRMMATTEIGAIQDWPVIAAYLLAQMPIFLLGVVIGGLLFRQSLAEMTIQGFGSSFSNTVILGLPLALSLYDAQGGVAALLIITLDILLFGLVTMLLELGTLRQRGRGDASALIIMGDILASILKNPIILAPTFGIAWALLGPPLPTVIDKTLSFTGQAGPPAGLFALGAALSLREIRGNLSAAGAMVGLKLFLHPLLTWFVVTRFFDLDPVYVSVAIILAACPVGANTYVFAEQYDSGVETSATAVLISTGLALFSIAALTVVMRG